MAARPSDTPIDRLIEVVVLFLRLGATAFGGPAAHIALIDRECVERRRWMTREQFLEVLGVANLIPGPTSTELAMHVGRLRAGWLGLVVAGVAFIAPAALLVGVLAWIYVRTGTLPVTGGVLAAVQPVVIVIVLQAIVPLGRTALRSVPLAVLAAASVAAALAGVPEIYVLLAAGLVHAAGRAALGTCSFARVTTWVATSAAPGGAARSPVSSSSRRPSGAGTRR